MNQSNRVGLANEARDMFFRMVKEYANRQSVTEKLKGENQIEWVGRLNNIRVCVREVVEKQIIFA